LQLLSWQPIEDILCDEDEDALKYLTGVNFEERESPEEYKLVFVRACCAVVVIYFGAVTHAAYCTRQTFAANPYFSDTQLWKVISTATKEPDEEDEEGDEPFVGAAHVVEASGIRWKNTEQAQALKSRVDAAVGDNQEDDEEDDGAGASIFMVKLFVSFWFASRDVLLTNADLISPAVPPERSERRARGADEDGGVPGPHQPVQRERRHRGRGPVRERIGWQTCKKIPVRGVHELLRGEERRGEGRKLAAQRQTRICGNFSSCCFGQRRREGQGWQILSVYDSWDLGSSQHCYFPGVLFCCTLVRLRLVLARLLLCFFPSFKRKCPKHFFT
jgi:hypothetical protein